MLINNVRHGEYVDESKPGLSDSARARAIDVASDFDYMFPELARDPASKLPEGKPEEVVEHLKALARAMVDTPSDSADANSLIPPIYTYWGQFIDHDVTANTDRDSEHSNITAEPLKPRSPDDVIKTLKNLRRPALDLDSVYGDGPGLEGIGTEARHFYDGVKFRLGTVNTEGPIPGELIPDTEDLARDLPRIGTLIDADVARADDFPADLQANPAFRRLAWIGDMRNDENTVVAQFHTAILRFHNATVDWVQANENPGSDRDLFNRAQELTRHHYQWLVINDFLRRVTYPGTVDAVLYEGRKFFDKDNRYGKDFMPLEHSVAAYRFGHSMVRGAYDFNRNFGRGARVAPAASFDLLFAFTGRGGFLGSGETLPFNWVIEFDRFVDVGTPFADRFARKIDTRLAPPLGMMNNEIVGLEADPNFQSRPVMTQDRIKELLKHLAMRNMVRGYLLSLPTGQAVAEAMGVTPLSQTELQLGNTPELNGALADGGFLERTPLWYYLLKEAEIRGNGECLGPAGSRIIAETFIGLIDKDSASYRNRGWDPSQGVHLPDGRCLVTIRELIEFAGLPV